MHADLKQNDQRLSASSASQQAFHREAYMVTFVTSIQAVYTAAGEN
jgi:hypothetical protein